MRRCACSRALALWLTGASASEHVGGLGTVLLPTSIHVLDRGGKVRFFINTSAALLRGLAIVGPACIHQRNAREAARRAHLDAFGADRGAPWRDPTNGG